MWMKEGNVQRAALHTDALETQLFPMLEQVLCQVRWDGMTLGRQVQKKLSGILTDEQLAMLEDVVKWLETLNL